MPKFKVGDHCVIDNEDGWDAAGLAGTGGQVGDEVVVVESMSIDPDDIDDNDLTCSYTYRVDHPDWDGWVLESELRCVSESLFRRVKST